MKPISEGFERHRRAWRTVELQKLHMLVTKGWSQKAGQKRDEFKGCCQSADAVRGNDQDTRETAQAGNPENALISNAGRGHATTKTSLGLAGLHGWRVSFRRRFSDRLDADLRRPWSTRGSRPNVLRQGVDRYRADAPHAASRPG